MNTSRERVELTRPDDPICCPWCTSARVRPFVPLAAGVEYRCRDCGWRWAVTVSAREERDE